VQDAILFSEAGQLLALGGGEAGLAVRAIRARLVHPIAQGRFGQPQIARRCRYCFPLVLNEPDGAGFVVIGETAPSPFRLSIRHGRHRIHLSEDVHESGSSPLRNASVYNSGDS